MILLSRAQYLFLECVARFGGNIYDTKARLKKPQATVSQLRNNLLRDGLLEPWAEYDDPIVLSQDGKASLAEHENADFS